MIKIKFAEDALLVAHWYDDNQMYFVIAGADDFNDMINNNEIPLDAVYFDLMDTLNEEGYVRYILPF